MKEETRKYIVNNKKVVASIDRLKFTLSLKDKNRNLFDNILSENFKKSIVKNIPYTYLLSHIYTSGRKTEIISQAVNKDLAIKIWAQQIDFYNSQDVNKSISIDGEEYIYRNSVVSPICEGIINNHDFPAYRLSKKGKYLVIEINDVLQYNPDISIEEHLKIIFNYLFDIDFLSCPYNISTESAINYYIDNISLSELEIAIDMSHTLGSYLYNFYDSVSKSNSHNTDNDDNNQKVSCLNYDGTIYSCQSIFQYKLKSLFKIYNRSLKDRYDAGHPYSPVKPNDVYRFEVTFSKNVLNKIERQDFSKDINSFLSDNSDIFKTIIAKHLFRRVDSRKGCYSFMESKNIILIRHMYNALTGQDFDFEQNVFTYQRWYNELRDNLLFINRYDDSIVRKTA